MWTRALLKANAKTVLRRSYWNVFLMCLIASILTGSVDLNINFSGNSGGSSSGAVEQASRLLGGNPITAILSTAFLMLGILALVLALVVVLCWGILFTPIIRVGQCRYMMENRSRETSLKVLFSGFTTNYWGLVSGMFYVNLRIFLYTLLLVIPGVIKSYQYAFVPYLLAENPNLEAARAAEISTIMTDGEKWNIFVLDLSFCGWNILGYLLFGLGILFVNPYYEATKAELYAAMRAKVVASGYVSEAELSGQIF